MMESDALWPAGIRVAVSLTYDGALPEHLDVAGPTLESLGFRGTFFLSPTRTLENVQGWQTMAEAGHEMGNGCLLGVSDEGRLPNWSLRMVEQDIHMTQAFFASIFPEAEPISFAYPGRVPQCEQGSYRRIVEEEFSYSRSAIPGDNRFDESKRFFKVRDVTDKSVDELELWKERFLEEIEDDESEPVWHILRFGKMFDGETNRLLLLHELCSTFLNSHRDKVWVAPMQTVASCLESPPILSLSR